MTVYSVPDLVISNAMDSRNQAIVEMFSSLEGWEPKYKKIIEMGKGLKGLQEEDKVEDLKVRGCQSQVWLKASLSDEGKIHFEADSDALIVKGLVALLLHLYSDLLPEDILKTEPEFVKGLGLDGALSPSRTNGLFAMIKQIKFYALAYQAKAKLQGR